MKTKIFDDMNAGPFKAKVDERFHKLGHDCPDDGWVTGYLLRDLHKGEVLPHIFNCPCTWIVKEETIEPVGFHIAQWIKVEDRLPEEGKLCVVRWCGYDGVEYLVGEFEEYNYQRGVFGFSCGERFALLRDVTHWMPIVPPLED